MLLVSKGCDKFIMPAFSQGGQRPRLGPDVDLETVASDKYCKGFS